MFKVGMKYKGINTGRIYECTDIRNGFVSLFNNEWGFRSYTNHRINFERFLELPEEKVSYYPVFEDYGDVSFWTFDPYSDLSKLLENHYGNGESSYIGAMKVTKVEGRIPTFEFIPNSIG